MTKFSEYVAHGWKLCPIPSGLKGPTAPGWNKPESMVTHPLAADRLTTAGLCHAYSGTCAIDIDDMAEATAWLKERGIDLGALYTAADAVRIKSPAANRGKLIYAMPLPLPSKKIYGSRKQNIIDFRCGTANGLTVQDVLPPSPHPDANGVIDGRYEWVGDWHNLPMLPDELFTLWSSLISVAETHEVEPTQPREQLIALLRGLDPDMGRDDWVRVGMAIHHEFGGSEEGFALWDAWSRQGKKYVGSDMRACWNSFTPGSGITGQSLVTMQEASADDFPSDDRLQAINQAAAERAKAAVADVPLITWDDLAAPHDAPPYLVDRLIEHGAEVTVIGPTGSYKSLFTIELGASIAAGVPFFGHKVEQGLVVYLCGEGQGGMRHRIQALIAARGLSKSLPFVVYPRPLALPTDEGVQTVKQYIAAAEARYNQKLALLVIDTFGRYAAGEENVAEDLYRFFKAAGRCRGQAALLVVHHTGHGDATRGRGTSAWAQAADTEFIASIKDDTETRVFENTKQKDGEPAPPMFFRLTRTQTFSTRVGEPIFSVVLEPTVMEVSAPKLTAHEQLIYDAVSVGGSDMSEVIARVVEQLPVPGGKDNRADKVRRAITSLVAKKTLSAQDEQLFKADDMSREFSDLIGNV